MFQKPYPVDERLDDLNLVHAAVPPGGAGNCCSCCNFFCMFLLNKLEHTLGFLRTKYLRLSWMNAQFCVVDTVAL